MLTTKIIVRENQSLLDIALQQYGDVSMLVPLAYDNGISITEDLEAGSEIIIDPAKIKNKDVAQYYKDNKVIVATYSPQPKTTQTITFNPLGVLEVGDVVILTAVASSGLTITYSVDDELIATVVGDILTIIGIGSFTITASQAGDNIFFPASVNQMVTTVEPDLTPAFLPSILSFDFDPTKPEKFVLDGIEILSYMDRGITLAPYNPPHLPLLYAGYAFFGGSGATCPLTTEQDANCTEVWIVHSQGNIGFGNATIFCSNISESQLFSTADSATVWRNWAGNIKVNNVPANNFASPPTAKQTVSGEAGTVKIAIGRTFRASAAQSGWFGAIQRVLCINRVLTAEERTELQAYLEIYHSF